MREKVKNFLKKKEVLIGATVLLGPLSLFILGKILYSIYYFVLSFFFYCEEYARYDGTIEIRCGTLETVTTAVVIATFFFALITVMFHLMNDNY